MPTPRSFSVAVLVGRCDLAHMSVARTGPFSILVVSNDKYCWQHGYGNRYGWFVPADHAYIVREGFNVGQVTCRLEKRS